MFNSQRPRPEDLPTSRQLIRATALAAVAAGAILVTVVLPSEYAIDPTGIGGALGLTEMGEVKLQLAKEAGLTRPPELLPPLRLPKWRLRQSPQPRRTLRNARKR